MGHETSQLYATIYHRRSYCKEICLFFFCLLSIFQIKRADSVVFVLALGFKYFIHLTLDRSFSQRSHSRSFSLALNRDKTLNAQQFGRMTYFLADGIQNR